MHYVWSALYSQNLPPEELRQTRFHSVCSLPSIGEIAPVAVRVNR